jgi:hypothetical protein
MLTKFSFVNKIPFYPLLWSLYPILVVAVNNIDQISINVILRPLIVSLAATALLIIFLQRNLKDRDLTASATTLIIILFYSYGHVYNLLEGRLLMGLTIGRHRFLLPLWCLVGFVILRGIIRWKQNGVEWRRMMNILAIILFILTGLQISMHSLRGILLQQENKQAKTTNTTQLKLTDGVAPDVYYIILDGYARQDTLSQEYGLDNGPFLDELTAMGFFIADCTQSNYGWTPISISSSLNMDYLEAFSHLQQVGDEHMDYQVFLEYITNNPVRENFTLLGYKYITFETGWPFTEIPDADLYIQRQKNPLEQYTGGSGLTAFEVMLSKTTMLLPLSELKTAWIKSLPVQVRTPEERNYDLLKFSMTELGKLPNAVPGPKFVFAHLVTPHAPYVFDANGNFSDVGTEEIGYPNAIRYLDKWFLEFAHKLIDNSPVPPIIIVQGDHGWKKGNRLSILNAYYLPDAGDKSLYDTITPVNSFRVIFNTYFGGNYPLLEDRSFSSSLEKQLLFEQVPQSCVSEP